MDGSSGGQRREDDGDLVGQKVGHYLVESHLGRGGMGEVYLARDTRFPRQVALKRIARELRDDGRFRRRLIAEAEKAIRISDARIASVLDVLDENGEIFLVMEYVQGPTLRQRLTGPLGFPVFLDLAIECTEALVAAHRAGILHRDVKPENFVVSPNGAVKLLDLGVAKDLPVACGPESRGSAVLSTRSGITGTPLYMSPEVLLGRNVDRRADLFSLGTMFYEMLAGNHPFRGATLAETNDRILHTTPQPLEQRNAGVQPHLARLIERMLAKEPEDRPPTAHDVLHDLLELRQQSAREALEPTVPVAPRYGAGLATGRRRVAVAVFAVMALVAACWIGFGRVSRRLHHLLPAEKHVAFLSIAARDSGVEARVFAAGLTSVLDRTLRRLTDPHAFERSGGTASSHRYLRSVKLDDVRFGANLLLSGQLQSASDECRVGLTLADARDSSRLRSASVEAPRGDGMALAERVLAAACQVLELGLAPAELHAVWRPGTHHALAYAEDLRGLGDLWAVTSRPAPKATPRSGGLPSVLTEGAPLDPARARAALLDDAQAAFRRALAADSTDSQAWLGLANVAWWEREGPEGIEAARRSAEACQRALELNLEDAGAHALLGEIYAQTDRDPAAVPELERASELDPTNDETLRQLARVYEHLGRVQDVERIYRVAVERRPDYYYWHSWYGYFCFKRARYDEAARHYQRAIDLAPGDALSYSYLGGVYLMQGRYQSAIPHFKASLALGPSRSAYSNLATVYFLTRRFAAAESTYLRAIELAKDDFLLWGNLGDAYYWDPVRRDSAATAYRRAWQLAQAKLETNQEDAGTLGLAAYYRAKLDKRSAARALLYRALALSPHDHDVLYKAALVHQQWGEADSALVYLDRALAAGHSRLWVQDTPELDALRPDPRYGRLWKK